MTPHTLSFCILCDSEPVIGPSHIVLTDFSTNELRTKIYSLTDQFKTDKNSDPSGYFNEYFFDCSFCTGFIIRSLNENKFYVKNQYEGRYVIAFAIDYTRFEIFSEGCAKRLIEWRPDVDTNADTDPINDAT